MGYLAQFLTLTIFLPWHQQSWIILFLVLLLEFLAGFWVVRRSLSLALAWCFPVISVMVIHWMLLQEKAGFRMGALILVLLLGMKVVTAYTYRYLPFSWRIWTLYTLTWVGMNPMLFFKRGSRRDAKVLFWQGMRGVFSGSLLLAALAITVRYYDYQATLPVYWLSSLLLLASLSLILHFGLLNINAAVLQHYGYPAYALFKAPLQSRSLKEFWGKRWNIAFSEMTAAVAYRPLSRIMTRKYALLLSFMFSGILHVVALSLSVQQTYLLPLSYFLLHGLLMIVEGYWDKPLGRWWVLFWLLLPLPMLFHQAVMKQVFWPLVFRNY